MLREENAQGAIELLLLLAGIIFIAAVVGLYLKQTATQLAEDINAE